jgi:polar amino acid transport system substrate-binding protein
MFRLALLSLMMTFCLSVNAEKITAAGDPWPPFLDPKQANQGLIIEISKAAFATQGYELEMNFVPWARALAGVKNATYDLLLGTWWTEERTGYLLYSDPYLENSVKFIKKKGSSFEYDGLASLSGKSVGVVRDYGYGDDFLSDKGFRRPEAKDFIGNVRKLAAGRIDLTLEDELVAKAIIAKNEPALLDKIEFCNLPLSSNALHVTSGLSNSKHKKLIAAFNKGLAEIKANGVYDKIIGSLTE